jgi:hypothetical protein
LDWGEGVFLWSRSHMQHAQHAHKRHTHATHKTHTNTHVSYHTRDPPPPPRRALDIMSSATAKPARPRQLSQEEERALPVQERLYRSVSVAVRL